jgi:S-adenosylmethionine:tRNA ribosyltransferase-isomerase
MLPLKSKSVRVSDFHFDLPEELIAQTPPAVRGTSRMLVLDRSTGAYIDERFSDLPAHLRAGDVLVLNDSRVLPARLYATRAGLHTQHNSPDPTGRIEVLLTQQTEPNTWSALVRPGRKVQPGERLHFRDEFALGETLPLLEAEVIGAGDFGERTLRFLPTPKFLEILDRIGHMPLPPYIHRPKDAPDTAEDKARYQTVYAQKGVQKAGAQQAGSAAAPTAGLHFTPEILDRIRQKGVRVETLTLHVGLGTFQPVRVEEVADIRLHAEHYTLPAATAEAINSALAQKRRIIAAGTTTTRTLEHCALVAEGKPLEAHSGSTSIFLSPGHRFQVVNGLLTNFHLPQSTLLMLVSAFAGREAVLAAYAHAVRERYRFFSYGDCMLIL